MSPVEVVEEQFAAYNARDLERFMACFSNDIRTIRLPEMRVVLEGKAAHSAFYARERFVHADLRAELLQRIVLGERIIDHELIHGVGPEPIEMVVIYVVQDGLIVTDFSIPQRSL